MWILGKLNELFEDTEALLVGRQILEVVKNVGENVLSLVLCEGSDDLLEHVVALLVLRQVTHVVVLQQRLLDQLELFLLGHCVNDVLKGVCSSIVTRNFDEFGTFYLLQEVDTLVHLKVFY